MSDPQHQHREWLRSELAKAGHGAKSKLAEHLGVRNDAITRMLNGGTGKEGRSIQAHELEAMREFFAAASEPHRMSEDDEWREHSADFERVDVDSAYSDATPYQPKITGALPELDAQGGAGEGTVGDVYVLPAGESTVSGHRVIAEWKFSDEWLRAEVKASPTKTIVLPVIGDSMVPTYQPGDRVLVDTTQRDIMDGVVFVVCIDEGAPSVKRILEVFKSKPRMLTIVSDNAVIRDRDVEASIVRVIGRVVGKVSRQ